LNNINYYKNLWIEKTLDELSPKWSYNDDLNELRFFLDDKRYDCLELGCGNRNFYSIAIDTFLKKIFVKYCP